MTINIITVAISARKWTSGWQIQDRYNSQIKIWHKFSLKIKFSWYYNFSFLIVYKWIDRNITYYEHLQIVNILWQIEGARSQSCQHTKVHQYICHWYTFLPMNIFLDMEGIFLLLYIHLVSQVVHMGLDDLLSFLVLDRSNISLLAYICNPIEDESEDRDGSNPQHNWHLEICIEISALKCT